MELLPEPSQAKEGARATSVPPRQIDPAAVATAHDAMAAEYDDLNDLWYPWLFAQIHEFIVGRLPRTVDGAHALDVGCGTGFQSFLLARAGLSVTGFDIAQELVRVAATKVADQLMGGRESTELFRVSPRPSWLCHHWAKLDRMLRVARGELPIGSVAFHVGDLCDWAYGEGRYDVITCCGSVLSFVDEYESALARMASGLKVGGLLFVEVEQKRNPDLLWPVVDRVAGGALGYEQTWGEILRNLFSRPGRSVRVDYPFELHDGREVVMPIWLFSVREMAHIARRAGLTCRGRIGVHHVTNALPSTILHNSPPRRWASAAFRLLRPADGALAGLWPFWRLGCSAVYCFQKRDRGPCA